MAYLPYSPEFGCKYNLVAGDGSIASFNDLTDPNYCGQLSDVTGLDSPDVRESGDVLVQSDGGWQGNNWYGRRPIAMMGTVVNPTDALDRATKIDRMMRVSNAMRQDAVLTWFPSAGPTQMQTWVRRQQPVRFTSGWNKTFQMLLVAKFAPLFSSALKVTTSAASVTAENQGSYPASPVIRVTGLSTNPIITNFTTGQVVKFLAGYTVAAGSYIDVDILNHTILLNGTTDQSGNFDFVGTNWPALIKGNNTYTLTGGGTLRLTYRDAWL